MTAGGSAPEILIRRVVDRISLLTGAVVSQAIGIEGGVSFPLLQERVQRRALSEMAPE